MAPGTEFGLHRQACEYEGILHHLPAERDRVHILKLRVLGRPACALHVTNARSVDAHLFANEVDDSVHSTSAT